MKVIARNPDKGAALNTSGAAIIHGDLRDKALLQKSITGCHAVFHIGGALTDFKSRTYYHDVNVVATKTLADAALAESVDRFIHISTVSVYGLDARGLINEHAPLIPSNDFYTDTKLLAEQYIRRLIDKGLPAIIVQPAPAYGPGDEHWTLRPLRLIISGKMLMVPGL